jgi:xylitol oxidase
MDKREFLKTASIAAGGLVTAQLFGCKATRPGVVATGNTNWAGNLQYSTNNIHQAANIEEVRKIIAGCSKLRPLGSRHSFNTIADSPQNLISVRGLNKVIGLNKEAGTVTVEAGITYGDLALYLDKNGYALANLASLPHITVGGACATATHGSGVNNPNLSAAVVAVEFVTASGDIVSLPRKEEDSTFNGAVVGLGAFGVVTQLTLEVQQAYEMQQYVYRNLSIDVLKEKFYEIMSLGYSVSFFTDWKNKNINEVWIKKKVDSSSAVNEPAAELYGAKLATANLHPVETQSTETVTDQLGKRGPWYERLPHFKMGFKPSTGKELQSEFFVAIEDAYDAMMAVEALHEQINPHLFISEIRTIKSDDLWMSPCYKKNCVAIHTTWKQETIVTDKLIPMVEKALEPFKPRPHWAKLFSMTPEVLRSRIERLADFRQLAQHYDPHGKFRNDFIDKYLF